jgi:putative ABC transport system permease protein
MVILGTLVTLAVVNAVVITWTTVLATRHASAVARALGATPQQVSNGLAMAQILPALAGAILGVPGGLALLYATEDNVTVLPPAWHFAAVVLVAVVLIALLTAIPARAGGRRPVAEILQSERD